MATADIEQYFNEIVAAVAQVLQPHGFIKRRRAFRKVVDGNAAIVEFQRSVSSNSDAIRFTLNCGVIVGRLLEDRSPPLPQAGTAYAQLRMRIGQFLADPEDRWWEASRPGDVASAAAELTDLLISRVVPFLLDHLTDAQIIALWDTGRCPGLTEGQRVRYLAELKGSAHTPA